MGWANRITIARAALTLVLWALLTVASPEPSRAMWWATFGLFVVTALSDAVDGLVARHFGEVSVFGRIADPLVDKLLVLGTMVVLLGVAGTSRVLPAWAVALMMAREVIVTALRGAVEGTGVSFQALPLGKLKMLLQSFALGGVFLCGAGVDVVSRSLVGGPDAPWSATHLVVLLATLVTVVSGIDYAVRAWRLLRHD